MEFKGTKGKWTIGELGDNYLILDSKKNILNINCNRYNAQLISCAPEMLDALHEMVCAFEKNSLNDVSFAKELITKATTI